MVSVLTFGFDFQREWMVESCLQPVHTLSLVDLQILNHIQLVVYDLNSEQVDTRCTSYSIDTRGHNKFILLHLFL